MRRLMMTAVLAAVVAGACVMGCKTPQLAPGGAYTTSTTNINGAEVSIAVSGDIALFTADSAFGIAYDTLDTAFLFEYNNRAYLWSVSPAIKKTLDTVRPQALLVRNDYAAARAAYVANPVPAGMTGLQAILARMQQLVATANAALMTATNSAAPLPQ